MSEIEDLVEAYRAQLQLPWERSPAGGRRVWFAVYDPADDLPAVNLGTTDDLLRTRDDVLAYLEGWQRELLEYVEKGTPVIV